MSTYRRVKVQLHPFLTPALDGSERSAPRCGRFTSAERATGPNCRLDTLEKRKSLVPTRNRDFWLEIFLGFGPRIVIFKVNNRLRVVKFNLIACEEYSHVPSI